MPKMNKWIALFLVCGLLYSSFLLGPVFAQQVTPEETNETVEKEENQDKIIPGPQNIKESAGIYVFVAWMWLAIFVLIYLVRLKIKEVDRLFKIRFLSQKKK